MSRIDRMFELIQVLRSADRPLTGRELADRLEVSLRSIYRYCTALQSMGIPIEGEAGVGYILRRSYNLPPLSFTPDESEAILIGLRMIARLGDKGLVRLAEHAISKMMIAASVSEVSCDVRVFVSVAGTPSTPDHISQKIRSSIKDETILDIVYRDKAGSQSERRIWPLCQVFYPDATVVAAWCELRNDFRHFRLDWILEAQSVPEVFADQGSELRKQWQRREKWDQEYPGAVGVIKKKP